MTGDRQYPENSIKYPVFRTQHHGVHNPQDGTRVFLQNGQSLKSRLTLFPQEGQMLVNSSFCCTAFRTSSRVVIPFSTFCRPLTPRLVIPVAMAASLITSMEAEDCMSSLILCPIIITSSTTVRPLYPNWPHFVQPVPR